MHTYLTEKGLKQVRCCGRTLGRHYVCGLGALLQQCCRSVEGRALCHWLHAGNCWLFGCAVSHRTWCTPATQVDEEEALALARKGAVIVDVRLADDYKVRGRLSRRSSVASVCFAMPLVPAPAHTCTSMQHASVQFACLPSPLLQKEHIEGAVSVPMFRLTQGTSNWDNVKRVRGQPRAIARQQRCGKTAGTALQPSQGSAQVALLPLVCTVCDGQLGDEGHGAGPRLSGQLWQGHGRQQAQDE